MPVLVALLRAVNVGGTGKLPMADLRALCEGLGFADVRTYIQSGNVVFRTRLAPASAKARLEAALATRMGKPVAALMRTAVEIARLAAGSPFPRAAPNQVLVLFLDHAPPRGALAGWPIPGRERLVARGREVWIHFPDGMGRSKLKLPFADVATGRNLNTVAALAELAAAPTPR